MVNVSRAIIDAARARFAHVTVIEVTAPAEVLAARLIARGREDPAAINDRLARVAAPVATRPGVIVWSTTGVSPTVLPPWWR